MPELVTSPVRVPVPGGKLIDEYVGRASTGSEAVSVAHMRSPAGWEEPAQVPEFDEVTLVLAGAVHLEHPAVVLDVDGGVLEVPAGSAVVTRAGERVRYTTPQGAEYVAVCLPAFSPDTVNREG